MRDPDPSLEDRRLPIPMASSIPVFAAFAWMAFTGQTNKVLMCASCLVFLAGSLYSQISTGWAHDGLFKAAWSRGSDYDAIYWLNVVITAAAMCIFGWAFVAFMLAA